jgi:hypothetical protein
MKVRFQKDGREKKDSKAVINYGFLNYLPFYIFGQLNIFSQSLIRTFQLIEISGRTLVDN